MFKRGGLEEVCSLLVSVGHEPMGLPSSPNARPQSQGQPETSETALHGSENAPEAGQDRAAVQGSGPVADSTTEQQSGQCAHQRLIRCSSWYCPACYACCAQSHMHATCLDMPLG